MLAVSHQVLQTEQDSERKMRGESAGVWCLEHTAQAESPVHEAGSVLKEFHCSVRSEFWIEFRFSK